MRLFIISLLTLLPLTCFAQNYVNPEAKIATSSFSQPKIVKYYGEIVFTDVAAPVQKSVKIDFGVNSVFGKRYPEFKDENGKAIRFTTVVDALNYMSARGWVLELEYDELYIDEGSSFGGIKHFVISKTLNVQSECDETSQNVDKASLSFPAPAVVIDKTYTGLVLYYPPTNSIDLRCLDRPDPEIDKEIVFCCAGAYTGTGEKGHSNIAGDHVSSGRRFKGYKCTRNTGCFVFYNGKWKFLYEVYSNELDSAAVNNGAGYAQEMLIHDGKRLNTARPDDNVNLFRALCERDGKLCIADATNKMAFGDFKQLLLDIGIKEALYTDMGHGWNYSWYREYADSSATFIHKEYQDAATNWIVFYAPK